MNESMDGAQNRARNRDGIQSLECRGVERKETGRETIKNAAGWIFSFRVSLILFPPLPFPWTAGYKSIEGKKAKQLIDRLFFRILLDFKARFHFHFHSHDS